MGQLNSHAGSQTEKTEPARQAYLVYFDSTDLHWCPDIGNTYTAVAEQCKVDSPGKANPWLALFGSLIYPNGEGLYTIHQRKRHQEVEVHLQRLIDLDPDGFFFVIMDNASAHKTSDLDAFWDKNKARIEPVFLPTYSPHLNLIERLWAFMRSQMTKNVFYENLKTLSEAVVDWLEKLPFSRFCSLLGIDETACSFV